LFHPQATAGWNQPAESHGSTAPVVHLQRRSNLLRRIREGAAQSAIDHSDALVDRGSGEGGLLAGLESDVIGQGGIGDGIQRDRPGMVKAFPPAKEVKQDIRVTSNRERSQAAEAFHIEITVHPIDLSAGGLLDDAEGAAGGIGGGLVEDSEAHCTALSSSAWN